jgi:hypothetical protein
MARIGLATLELDDFASVFVQVEQINPARPSDRRCSQVDLDMRTRPDGDSTDGRGVHRLSVVVSRAKRRA